MAKQLFITIPAIFFMKSPQIVNFSRTKQQKLNNSHEKSTSCVQKVLIDARIKY